MNIAGKRNFEELTRNTNEMLDEQVYALKRQMESHIKEFQAFSNTVNTKIKDVFSKLSIFALQLDVFKASSKKKGQTKKEKESKMVGLEDDNNESNYEPEEETSWQNEEKEERKVTVGQKEKKEKSQYQRKNM